VLFYECLKGGVFLRNQFLTIQQIARLWGISDRRVRVLCKEGRIPGVYKDSKSYRIPADAVKPADGRREKKTAKNSFTRFLKWGNQTIGTIDDANFVKFTIADFNDVVAIYTRD